MKPYCTLTLASLLLIACGDDGGAEPGAGGTTGIGGTEAAGGSNSVDPEVLAYYDCEEPDFEVFAPLGGPGYDPEQGGLLEPHQDSYVVHTTQLIVKPGSEAKVLQLSGGVIAQLQETPGHIAYSLAGSDACGNVRTMGIWASEEAMYGMVNTGAHAEAMAQTADVSITGKVTHWEATAAEVQALTWETAKSRIDEAEPSPIYE